MREGMPVLDAKTLCKRLGTRTLLEDVDLTIARGEKVGVVGDNGSGKSTLARILAGRMDADGGQVIRRRGARVAYLDQEPQFSTGLTALETTLRSFDPWWKARQDYELACARLASSSGEPSSAALDEQERLLRELDTWGGFGVVDEAARLLSQLGISTTDQAIETMSGGERRRVALAALLLEKPDLAILDEPTNHLDATTIEWLESYFAQSFAGALLLITHDRWLLSSVVTRTLEVEAGHVHSHDGGWEEFLEAKAERQAHQEREERNRQNFLRTELEWLRRQPKARTGKSKARIQRAESALSVQVQARQDSLALNLEEARLGSTILEAHKLGVAIDGRRLVDNLNLQLGAGSRVGIVGPSGAGKTTLLRTLVGQRDPSHGTVVRGKNTRIAYLDQARSGLDDQDTVFDAITGGHPTVTVGEQSYGSHSYLERFRFRGDAKRQKVGGLSGGERARVALAKLLLSSANVLVLDEPTNDLDVMTLTALEDLLLGLTGACLVVSHDRYFLDRVATSIIGLDGSGGAELVQGGYSDYLAWWERRRSERAREEKQAKATSVETIKSSSPPRATKRLTYAEELELTGLPERIEAATSAVRQLEQQLEDPTLHVERREEAAALGGELVKAQADLDSLETRWLELEERRDYSRLP